MIRQAMCTTQAVSVALLVCGLLSCSPGETLSKLVIPRNVGARWCVWVWSVYMNRTVCFGVLLWCCTQVFTLALGLGLPTLACWQQLGSVSRCELSSVLFGSLATLPLAPNTAVAWPTEQRSPCVCVCVCSHIYHKLSTILILLQNGAMSGRVDILVGPQNCEGLWLLRHGF